MKALLKNTKFWVILGAAVTAAGSVYATGGSWTDVVNAVITLVISGA